MAALLERIFAYFSPSGRGAVESSDSTGRRGAGGERCAEAGRRRRLGGDQRREQPVEPGQPGRDPGGAEAQGRPRVVHVICTVQRHLDRGAHCARRVGWTRSARTLLSHATWAACGQRLAVPADFGSSLATFNGGWNGLTNSLVRAT